MLVWPLPWTPVRHIIGGMQEEARTLLDEVLSPGVNGVKNKVTSPN